MPKMELSCELDGNKIRHLASWNELDDHICEKCSSGVKSRGDKISFAIGGKYRRGIPESFKKGCLRFKLAVSCLDWATPLIPPGKYIRVMLFRGDRKNDWRECEIDFKDQTGRIYLQLVLDNSSTSGLSASTSSIQTLDQLKNWLEECVQHHTNCRNAGHGSSNISAPPSLEKKQFDKDLHRQYQGYETPTINARYLSIENYPVRLVDTIKPDKYACLSHCWGPPQNMIKTEGHNLIEFKNEGIAWSRLPKTFRDAIKVCRHLGIKYLWIDSLCIIQGDSKDWLEQSSQMAAIYGGAFFTIAASKAHNPSQGLFTKRSSEYLDHEIPGFTGVKIRRKIPDPANIVKFINFHNPSDQVNWPLYFRGWCFQELRLSLRILHFGIHEVLWECKSFRRREGRPNDKEWKEISVSNPSKLVKDRVWHTIVESYSRRSLTYSKDRLPAIAAVAQDFRRLSNHEYIAGLWRETLLQDLLWSNQEPKAKRSSSMENKLPTWTWASLNGAVTYDYRGFRDVVTRVLAELCEVIYTTEGQKITGSIKEAIIRLRAPVICLSDVVLDEDFVKCKEEAPQAERVEKAIAGQFDAVGLLFGKPSRRLMTLKSHLRWDVPEAWTEHSFEGGGSEDLWVVPIMAQIYNGLIRDIRGPIVRKVGAQTFERVGYSVFQHLGACVVEFYPSLVYRHLIGEDSPQWRDEPDPYDPAVEKVYKWCSDDFEQWLQPKKRQEIILV